VVVASRYEQTPLFVIQSNGKDATQINQPIIVRKSAQLSLF
jgi:hypothetical protein